MRQLTFKLQMVIGRWRQGLLATVLLLGLAASAAPASAAPAAGLLNGKVDSALLSRLFSVLPLTPLDVVIVFDNTSAAPRVRALASKFIQMQSLPMAGAILPALQVQRIALWPEVDYIVLNRPLQYFLHESVAYIQADDVWTTHGNQGDGATVAIIDSGIDGLHPDLAGNVVQNVKVLPFLPPLENLPLTDTSSGHGTHVAGTIGGTGSFSSGYYRGVAPQVDLVGLGAGEVIAILTAVEAYDWVLANHAEYDIRVVSNSWGQSGGAFDPQDPINVASYAAYQLGILSVFAAGNDGGSDILNPYSLAPWVLSVAAGDNQGNLADFSSRGLSNDPLKHPDLTAPGVNIFSTRSSTLGITLLDPAPNPVNPLWTLHYTMMSGTSMATPHVSGAAALLIAGNPALSPDQLRDALVSTTTLMPGYALHEAGTGYLNALAAYEAGLAQSGELAAFLAGARDY